jgi:hypothetical protein
MMSTITDTRKAAAKTEELARSLLEREEAELKTLEEGLEKIVDVLEKNIVAKRASITSLRELIGQSE